MYACDSLVLVHSPRLSGAMAGGFCVGARFGVCCERG